MFVFKIMLVLLVQRLLRPLVKLNFFQVIKNLKEKYRKKMSMWKVEQTIIAAYFKNPNLEFSANDLYNLQLGT